MANVIGGSVVWNLDVDTKGLDSGLSSAKKSVDSAASDIEKRGDKMVGVLKNAAFAIGAAIGTAAGAFAVLGVKTAADLESATQGFVALLGSADEASDVIARIKREAASTPFEIAGLAAGTQAITAITKDGNKAIDIILDVGKAIAISGKGQAEFDNVVANLQQIAATGKVTELDVRQFQRAIPIFNDIIGAVGLTSEELKDADNSAELLFNAFKVAGQEGGIAAKGFSAQAGTFNQLMSNLQDTIAITSSDVITQTGLFDSLKGAIEGVSGAVEFLGGVLIKTSEHWREFEGEIKAVAAVIGFIALPALVELTITLSTRFIIALLDGIAYVSRFYIAIARTLVSGIITAGQSIIGFVNLILTQAIPAIGRFALTLITQTIPNILKTAVSISFNLISALGNFIIALVTQGIPAIGRFAITLITQTIPAIVNTGIALLVNGVKNIVGFAVAIFTQGIPALARFVITLLTQTIPALISFGTRSVVSGVGGVLAFAKSILVTGIPAILKMGVGILTGIIPALIGMAGTIFATAIPAIGALLIAIGPFLVGLAAIIAIVLLVKKAWDSNFLGIQDVTEKVVDSVVGFFSGIVDRIKGALSGAKDAILKPFNDAKDAIDNVVNGMKDKLSLLDPRKRQSPSLVDNIKKGLRAVESAYAGVKIPDYSPSIGGFGAGVDGLEGGRTVNINNQITMQRPSDIDAFSRRLSFEAQTI